MKRIFILLLCAAVLVFSLTGCSANNELTEENVEKTVNATVEALKEFDTEELNKYVDSQTLSVIAKYADKHQQFKDLGKAIFKDLSCEITNIDLENKQVTLKVSNKNLYDIANNFANELKSNYSTFSLLSKLDDEDFLDRKLNGLFENMDSGIQTFSTVEITLNIEQGKKNLVLVFDSEAENAVSGKALGAVMGVFSKASLN